MQGSMTKHWSSNRSLGVSLLLACGVLSSLVYAATDVLASMRWDGYDWTARMVSDLLAVSSPTRSFIVVPMVTYNLLILAFGMGVWSRGWNRALHATGAMFVVYAIVGMVGLFVFPLDYDVRGAGATMHMVATVALIALMFAFIGLAAAGCGWGFRLYSIATVAAILVGATLAGMQIPRIEAHLATPGLGIYERLNIYSMLLWVGILAIVLLTARRENGHTSAQ